MTAPVAIRGFKEFRRAVLIQSLSWIGAIAAVIYLSREYGLWLIPSLIAVMGLFPGMTAIQLARGDEETYDRYVEAIKKQIESGLKPKTSRDTVREWSWITKTVLVSFCLATCVLILFLFSMLIEGDGPIWFALVALSSGTMLAACAWYVLWCLFAKPGRSD